MKALKCVTVLSQYWSVNCWSLLTLLIHICSNWSSLDLVGFPQAFSIFLIQEVWNISSLSFHYGVFFYFSAAYICYSTGWWGSETVVCSGFGLILLGGIALWICSWTKKNCLIFFFLHKNSEIKTESIFLSKNGLLRRFSKITYIATSEATLRGKGSMTKHASMHWTSPGKSYIKSTVWYE